MDDNTYECPNCGATVYPEMTRCPECGQSMYPEEDDNQAKEAETGAPGWAASLGAIVIGWMIACGIALLFNFIVAAFTPVKALGISGKVVLWLAGPVGAGVGGYISGGMARSRWLGAGVGVLSLPILALFATHWMQVDLAFLIDPWVILAGVVTVVVGFVGGWLNYKLTQDTGWKEKWQVHGWEDLLYQDLLRKVRFNGSTADRLIDYERRQNPQASRLQLIQSAIERWERDNR